MFTDHWSPKVIAQMNDYQFKLVKIKGDFIWHNHSDTDEAFIVLEGTMFIELEKYVPAGAFYPIELFWVEYRVICV